MFLSLLSDLSVSFAICLSSSILLGGIGISLVLSKLR